MNSIDDVMEYIARKAQLAALEITLNDVHTIMMTTADNVCKLQAIVELMGNNINSIKDGHVLQQH